jgi:3-hydroxyisobutyrate dehydrogenase
MAARLLEAGHEITVWNRSPSAAEALVATGAKVARTPKEAASGAEYVLAMLRDNDASRQVWLEAGTGAFEGMSKEAIAIESSTLTAEWVRELGAHATERGLRLLEAPVVGSTPQAESGQLMYLVGGDTEAYLQSQSVLTALGSNIQHVGPLGSGALAKLVTNTMLGIQLTAIAELIGMLKHSGADVSRVLDVVSKTPAWSPVAARVSSLMLAGNFAPQFPIELIEKDFGYMLQSAESDSQAPTIAAARSVFRSAAERGLGRENMTAVVKLFT